MENELPAGDGSDRPTGRAAYQVYRRAARASATSVADTTGGSSIMQHPVPKALICRDECTRSCQDWCFAWPSRRRMKYTLFRASFDLSTAAA